MNKDRFAHTESRADYSYSTTARCVDNSQHRTKVSIFFFPVEPSRTKRVQLQRNYSAKIINNRKPRENE